MTTTIILMIMMKLNQNLNQNPNQNLNLNQNQNLSYTTILEGISLMNLKQMLPKRLQLLSWLVLGRAL